MIGSDRYLEDGYQNMSSHRKCNQDNLIVWNMDLEAWRERQAKIIETHAKNWHNQLIIISGSGV